MSHMTMAAIEEGSATENPLEILEDVLGAYEWGYQREAGDELVVDGEGSWCPYRMYFVWQEEYASLQFCCQFDVEVPDAVFAAVNELLLLMNERLWLGHFMLPAEERTPMFRYTLLLRGHDHATGAQLEDLIETALGECDRVFPAMQFILEDGKSAEDAFNGAILETAGEA